MPPQVVKYTGSAGNLTVEVTIGNLVYGHYSVKSRQPPSAPVVLIEGSNLHDASKDFAPSNGEGVSWEVVINKLPNGDAKWTVNVSLSQAGKVIYTAPYSGQFSSDQSIAVNGGILLAAG